MSLTKEQAEEICAIPFAPGSIWEMEGDYFYKHDGFDGHSRCYTGSTFAEVKAYINGYLEARREFAPRPKIDLPQVSGASPSAEIVLDNRVAPLPNASPTPGPGEVCGECGGKVWIQGTQNPNKPCPACHGTGKGSGLEGE